jgi:hypothetical protein
MRTTIAIQDDLLRRARKVALERDTSLRELVEDALRSALARPKEGVKAKPFRLATFRGRGLMPGVDLDHTASLLDVMESR